MLFFAALGVTSVSMAVERSSFGDKKGKAFASSERKKGARQWCACACACARGLCVESSGIFSVPCVWLGSSRESHPFTSI
jgi:hypothetical protein